MLLGRRAFLGAALRATGAIALGAPAIVRGDATRPGIPSGTASGDVTGDRAVVWSRTDRPARMRVEWATTESFQDPRRVTGAVATEASAFTARLDLTSLPAGQRIFYRVTFEDLADARNVSLPAPGSFLSAPDAPRDLTFAWSADTCGQGWGINRDWGGLKMYETIRRARPDFFLHLGDTIYADGPLSAERPLPDGTVWKNVVTESKAKVAETLDDFRGNHLYNLLDENVRRLNAEVPQGVVWDDHEVLDNWYPAKVLQDPRYHEKRVAVLARRARQAFLEHVPIRISSGAPRIDRQLRYGPLLDVFLLDLRGARAANSANRQRSAGAATALAGARQLAWLERALEASTATWKVIASSQPIGVLVRDGELFDGIANGDGPALGRELEVAGLLAFLRRRHLRNVVWLTADVHYAAAHRYDPERARFKGFDPFWEFVAGPLHGGTGPRLAMDDTFGPEVRFVGVPEGIGYELGPPSGLQFFGTVSIDAASGTMSVRLHDLSGEVLYSTELEPHR